MNSTKSAKRNGPISLWRCEKLVKIYHQRLVKVIAAKGHAIEYLKTARQRKRK